LLKKSYCVLDNYLSHNSKKEEIINDDWLTKLKMRWIIYITYK
jgi:hypothetical protein